MALAPVRLPRLPDNVQFIDPKTGFPSMKGQRWWQRAMEQIEAGVNGVIEAQNAADVAQTAAVAAQVAADTAQTAADTVAATVAALDIPPTGSVTVTASGSLSASDAAVLADASGGAITLGLPAASSFIGPITVTKTDASVNTVTVAATGGDVINSAATIGITAQYQTLTFSSDTVSAWYGG